MHNPSFAEKKHELLATAVTLIFAYYSLKASLSLSAFREMFVNMDADIPLFTQLVVGNSGMVTSLIVALAAITLWAVWSRHRFAGFAAAVGILSLGIGTQLLCSAAISPIMQMVNTMGSQ